MTYLDIVFSIVAAADLIVMPESCDSFMLLVLLFE